MSIYGLLKTRLGLHGCPANAILWGIGGSSGDANRPVLTLPFPLQLSGYVDTETQWNPPNLVAMATNEGISLVVTVVAGAEPFGTPVNIRAASLTQLVIVKPDLTRLVLIAKAVTNGLDGKLTADIPPSGIAQAGHYSVQASFVIARELKTTTVGKFVVRANL